MANVSARVDDVTKAKAEIIADPIGITLSTAISIFLNRFIAEKGFPFSVVANEVDEIDVKLIEATVKASIKNDDGIPQLPPTNYIDVEKSELI